VTRLLHIQASPRGAASFSLSVAEAFLAAFREAQPDAEVETLDLWATELPRLDGPFLEAKERWMAGRTMTGEEAAAWAPVEALARQFREADGYLFSVPMWSYGVPYPLKHYLDAIAQPGLLFRYDPYSGHRPLLRDRPACLVCARGDRYGAGSPTEGLDFQAPWLEAMLALVGIETTRAVLVEPTEGEPEAVAEVLRHAKEEAARWGGAFYQPMGE